MYFKLIAYLMLFLYTSNVFGCSAIQQPIPTTIPIPLDVPIQSPDVVLQGIENLDVIQMDTENLPPSIVFPYRGDQGEIIAPIFQDARAPFNGVLFNGAAIGRVQVEFRAQQERCLIDRRHEIDQVIARYNADIATLQLALDTQNRTDRVILQQRDSDIQRLSTLLQQSNQANNGIHIREGLIGASIGFSVGALIFGGILIYTQVNSH